MSYFTFRSEDGVGTPQPLRPLAKEWHARKHAQKCSLAGGKLTGIGSKFVAAAHDCETSLSHFVDSSAAVDNFGEPGSSAEAHTAANTELPAAALDGIDTAEAVTVEP